MSSNDSYSVDREIKSPRIETYDIGEWNQLCGSSSLQSRTLEVIQGILGSCTATWEEISELFENQYSFRAFNTQYTYDGEMFGERAAAARRAIALANGVMRDLREQWLAEIKADMQVEYFWEDEE
jgi:hypothetical protein